MDQHAVQDDIFRRMAPLKKLETAMSLHYSTRQLKTAWVRQRHREWSQQQVARAVREMFTNAGN